MTRVFLACGVVAGPLFIVTVLIQAQTRAGFDLGRHPISLLSLGPFGWIQVLNFAITGVLCVVCGVGLQRMGSVGNVIPAAVAEIGLGLVMAGLCITDPGAGFPPGAPEGAPDDFSWHGILHEVGFALSQIGWLIFATSVILRAPTPAWRWISAIPPVLVLVLVAWPNMSGLSVRLLLATAVELGSVAVVAEICSRTP
ncbi:DUF998 domain-containing protein [Nocardia sp. NPDC050175]|uniref:DUF998 domain-containing protein n=1 Tax=Nocardia sp. NPDC050175 TaxID=3364317 RepID=UPI0037B538FE